MKFVPISNLSHLITRIPISTLLHLHLQVNKIRLPGSFLTFFESRDLVGGRPYPFSMFFFQGGLKHRLKKHSLASLNNIFFVHQMKGVVYLAFPPLPLSVFWFQLHWKPQVEKPPFVVIFSPSKNSSLPLITVSTIILAPRSPKNRNHKFLPWRSCPTSWRTWATCLRRNGTGNGSSLGIPWVASKKSDHHKKGGKQQGFWDNFPEVALNLEKHVLFGEERSLKVKLKPLQDANVAWCIQWLLPPPTTPNMPLRRLTWTIWIKGFLPRVSTPLTWASSKTGLVSSAVDVMDGWRGWEGVEDRQAVICVLPMKFSKHHYQNHKKSHQFQKQSNISNQHQTSQKKVTITTICFEHVHYCWWKNATWDVWNPIDNGMNYQTQLVGRILSVNSSTLSRYHQPNPHDQPQTITIFTCSFPQRHHRFAMILSINSMFTLSCSLFEPGHFRFLGRLGRALGKTLPATLMLDLPTVKEPAPKKKPRGRPQMWQEGKSTQVQTCFFVS